MNSTLMTWLLGATIAGLAAMFLLGTPAGAPTPADAALTSSGGASAPEPAAASYWKSASAAAPSVATVPIAAPIMATAVPAPAAAPCPSCTPQPGTATPVAAPAAPLALMVSTPVAVSTPALVGGCGTPSTPCGEAPCGPLMTCGLKSCPACRGAHSVTCGAPTPTCGLAACAEPCAPPVCDNRPRINRNGPSCVDECTFIQLYSTVPLPVCKSVRFAWAATRGEFLDPCSPHPIYFAPSSGFPGGEEVLITLRVTDAEGNQYSDQMRLHINDVI